MVSSLGRWSYRKRLWADRQERGPARRQGRSDCSRRQTRRMRPRPYRVSVNESVPGQSLAGGRWPRTGYTCCPPGWTTASYPAAAAVSPRRSRHWSDRRLYRGGLPDPARQAGNAAMGAYPPAPGTPFLAHIRDPADTARLADSARNRLLYRYAIPLYHYAAEAGDGAPPGGWPICGPSAATYGGCAPTPTSATGTPPCGRPGSWQTCLLSRAGAMNRSAAPVRLNPDGSVACA